MYVWHCIAFRRSSRRKLYYMCKCLDSFILFIRYISINLLHLNYSIIQLLWLQLYCPRLACEALKVKILQRCYDGQSAVCSSTTRCKQRYTGLSHAFTHCTQSHPLIHRNIDTLSSLTQKHANFPRQPFCRPSFLFKVTIKSLTEFLLRK